MSETDAESPRIRSEPSGLRRIRFEPSGAAVTVAEGTTILSAALWARLPLASSCGGFGGCGECRVQVLEGEVPVTPEDRVEIPEAELEAGWRLACGAVPRTDLVCRVPEARIEPRGAVEGPTRPIPLEPLVRVEGGDGTTRIVRGREVLLEAKGPLSRTPLGLALDLGTTTVAGALVDLADGRVLSRATKVNAQVAVGADVIARAAYAHGSPGHTRELQGMAIRTINELLASLCREAGRASGEVYEVVATGNAIMLHLLLGVDPHPLAVSPFQPRFSGPRELRARESRAEGRRLGGLGAENGGPEDLGLDAGMARGSLDPQEPSDTSETPALSLEIHPAGRVVTFPLISAYAGGDLVAALLATELADREAPALMVDIGTNTEVALGWGGRVVTAAAPAGPAFEGSGIRCGLPAVTGAVAHLRMEDAGPGLSLDVMGGGEAEGLCGSGLVDVLGELRRTGLLDATGRLASRSDVPDHPQGRRLEGRGHTRAFRINEGVYLEQGDVRVLQTAVAAISSAIRLVLEHAGIGQEDLEAVYLAGSFGTALDPLTARCAGLVPRVPPERIRSVGNAALEGARMSLVSFRERDRAFQIPAHAEYLELSGHPGFNDAFTEAMTFPEMGERKGQ